MQPFRVAHKAHVNFLNRIKLHIAGARGYKKWDDRRSRIVGIERESRRWESRVNSMLLRDEWKAEVGNVGRSPSQWREMKTIWPSDIDKELQAVWKAIQGRRRCDVRRQINANVARIEDAFEEGKHKRSIN